MTAIILVPTLFTGDKEALARSLNPDEQKQKLDRKIASIRGAHSVDCKKLKARTEQVERLKKENAELRKQVSAMSKVLVLNVSEADEKLDRAKEIIASLLPFEHVIDPYALTSDFEENQKRFHEPFRKAEQFLKEE